MRITTRGKWKLFINASLNIFRFELFCIFNGKAEHTDRQRERERERESEREEERVRQREGENEILREGIRETENDQ